MESLGNLHLSNHQCGFRKHLGLIFSYLLILCVRMRVCVSLSTHTCITWDICSLLWPSNFQRWNLGCQIGWQAPLPTDPAHCGTSSGVAGAQHSTTVNVCESRQNAPQPPEAGTCPNLVLIPWKYLPTLVFRSGSSVSPSHCLNFYY